MKKVRVNVPNISCEGCKATIEEAVSSLNGVLAVIADVEGKYVDTSYNESDTSVEAITAKIADSGYQVKDWHWLPVE
jgi:copper chaperone CopZ